MPTRQPTTSSIVFSNVNGVASMRYRRAVKISLPVFFSTLVDALLDTHRSFVSSTQFTIPCAVVFTIERTRGFYPAVQKGW